MKFAMTIVLAALVSCGVDAASTLRAADTHPPDYPTVQAVDHMSGLLQERTKGRYRIQVFAGRQLGEEKETIFQTQTGAIDINRVNLASFNDVVPESRVPSLPFLFRSTEHLRRVMDGPVGRTILASFESHGFIGLAFYDSGARSFYTRVRTVKSVADLRGMRLRVQQSPLFLGLVEAIGAKGVALPYGQVLTALQTGLIDGAENNWPSYDSAGHFRVAPCYVRTEPSMAPEILVMSRVAWQKLSGPDREAVQRAATGSVTYMRALWDMREQEAEKRARAAGVTVIQLSPAERHALAEAMQPLYARFASDARLKGLVNDIRNTKP